jgi:uncharacterized protein (DUF983 family)
LAEARCAASAAALSVRSGGRSPISASTIAVGEMLAGGAAPTMVALLVPVWRQLLVEMPRQIRRRPLV